MVTKVLKEKIEALDAMKTYPKSLFFRGNIELLKRRKVAIVGTRKPSQYTREFTRILAQKLAQSGFTIVSGGAMGVDALAHKGAGSQNTIGVLANGLDIRYPKINASLLEDIENNGLLLSTYEDKTPSLAWQFVARNEIVVGLSEILIVCEADLNSGSMRSVAFAQNMHKKIYVLPHRMNESLGTHSLVKQNQAKAIHDIDAFIADIGGNIVNHEDTFLDFCKENDNYDEVVKHYADKVFEYELEGKIEVVNGKIIVKV